MRCFRELGPLLLTGISIQARRGPALQEKKPKDQAAYDVRLAGNPVPGRFVDFANPARQSSISGRGGGRRFRGAIRGCTFPWEHYLAWHRANDMGRFFMNAWEKFQFGGAPVSKEWVGLS